MPEYFGSSPYSKCAVVAKPSGSTVPEKAAELLDSTDGLPAVTAGLWWVTVAVDWVAGAGATGIGDRDADRIRAGGGVGVRASDGEAIRAPR